MFPAATEGFSKANLNCSVEESFQRVKQVADQAVNDGLRLRGYISCVVGCPYDGPVKPTVVAKVSLSANRVIIRNLSFIMTLHGDEVVSHHRAHTQGMQFCSSCSFLLIFQPLNCSSYFPSLQFNAHTG